MDSILRFNLNREITTTGDLGVFDVSDEVSARFVIENADVTNVFLVSGRVTGQTNFTLLGTLTGSTNELITVDTYDEINVVCSVYDSTGLTVKIIACSFNR